METIEMLKRAKACAPVLAMAGEDVRNAALREMADELILSEDEILSANRADTEAAEGTIPPVMIDRLRLDRKRLEGMARGITEVADLPDPLKGILSETVRPNGLVIRKIPVPLGLISIIYESRPNVTSDAAALCIKSGNACVLRGGKEAFRSCRAVTAALKRGLVKASLPEDLIFLTEDITRKSASDIMEAEGIVDALIPRGGAGLIRACKENSRVPVIETGTGICHIYVDADADLEMALNILDNAKTSRPSVCNAAECLLVHRSLAAEFYPMVYERLVVSRKEAGLVPVELRLDPAAAEIIPGIPAGEKDFDTEFLDYILAVAVVDDVDAARYIPGTPATEKDYDTEFNDYILSVKTVGSCSEAIGHIAAHSTHHSDCIVTDDAETADLFIRSVDSAAVYHNASTRFTDGGEFGLGCEMGISTQKLHARGPMGLRELTTYKYVVRGSGQIR